MATNKRPVTTRNGYLLTERGCSLDRYFRRSRNMMPNADARREFRKIYQPVEKRYAGVGATSVRPD
jgi:hypothetical protein